MSVELGETLHEWALAEAVVDTIKEFMSKGEISVIKSVKIRVGELQNIDLNIFKFALNELLKEASLEGIEIHIEKDEVMFKCRRCGCEWRLSDISLEEEELETIHFMPELVHIFASCPSCGSCDFDIIKGRGIWIEGIKGY